MLNNLTYVAYWAAAETTCSSVTSGATKLRSDRGSEKIDLLCVFLRFPGFAGYSAECSEGTVALESLEYGLLTVAPGRLVQRK